MNSQSLLNNHKFPKKTKYRLKKVRNHLRRSMSIKSKSEAKPSLLSHPKCKTNQITQSTGREELVGEKGRSSDPKSRRMLCSTLLKPFTMETPSYRLLSMGRQNQILSCPSIQMENAANQSKNLNYKGGTTKQRKPSLPP